MDLRTSLLAATALFAAFSSGAFAASIAVIDANAAAGAVATKACIAPRDNPFHEFDMPTDDAPRHPRCAECDRSQV